MLWPPIPVPAIAAAVALAVGAAGGWQVQAWRWAAADAARLEADAEAQRMAERRAGQAAQTYEQHRAASAAQTRVILQEVERVVDRPVYRDRECLDADGVRIVNAAGQAGAASQPDPAVPALAPLD